MTSISQPRPGVRRVAAWIYTVINPLIDALRREIHLLQEGNLSWRYYSQRFEYIRPLEEYIEPQSAPNLEDFLADNSVFVPRFELHDRNAADAEKCAREFYNIVIQAQIFQKEIDEAFRNYESKKAAAQPLAPDIESIREQLPKFVAENLINSTHDLPSHYTIHAFWKAFADEFQKFLSDFEAYTGRQSFRNLQQATATLKEGSSNLLRDLESQRLALCREYDLPPAQPLPAPGPADQIFVS